MDSLQLKQNLLQDSKILDLIKVVAEKTIEVYKQKRKTLIAGNGGSAADAQHIATEFVGRFYFNRPPLPSIALTTNTSTLTADANDYGYEELFVRQIQALGEAGDMFIGISTSGNSPNILTALKAASQNKIITVGLTGGEGGKMKPLCDYCIVVPSKDTPRIQEAHILIGHIICSCVEEALFGKAFVTD